MSCCGSCGGQSKKDQQTEKELSEQEASKSDEQKE
jgi:hypothetical protein